MFQWPTAIFRESHQYLKPSEFWYRLWTDIRHMYLYMQVVGLVIWIISHCMVWIMLKKEWIILLLFFIELTDFCYFRNLQFKITEYECKSFEAVIKCPQCFSLQALYTVYVQNETKCIDFVEWCMKDTSCNLEYFKLLFDKS
jgi:hypothetical protein